MSEKPTEQLTKEERRKRRAYRKRRKAIFPISRISFLITIIVSIIFFLVVNATGVVPGKWLLIFGLLLLIFNLYVAIVAISKKASNKSKLRQIFISVISCSLMLVGSIAIPSYKNKIAKIFNPMPSEGSLNINVYTLKDSQFNNVASLSGVPVATQSKLDREFQDYAIIQVNRELKSPIIAHDCKDIYTAVDLLYDGSVAAVMFNESYLATLEKNEEYKDFEERVQLVYQCVQKVSFEYNIEAVGNITKEPFVIGVLGDDESTLDSLGNTSGFRSDVNILCVVNPNTKQALIVTLPRDGYVAVDGNNTYMDKLTHSSLYSSGGKTGIAYWISTMNTLLDCEINYTLKVNFISVIRIIDALGGIDIDNPYAFTTVANHPYFGSDGSVKYGQSYSYEAGKIHLDANQTLAYVRERYNLPNGDFDRNKHQAIVLKALIDKCTSPAILTKANALLNAMKGTFMTNMKIDEMLALAQMQLDELSVWDVKTVSVGGEVNSRYCYQLEGEASVVDLDFDSINRAQAYIDQILNNQVLDF